VLKGQIGDRVAVRHVITPGISTYGAGLIDVELKLRDGTLRKQSRFSLRSDNFQVRIMGLDATGSGTVIGSTEKENGKHVTTARFDLADFAFVDPLDGSVDISGSDLALDAVWHGLSIASRVPASHAELVIPRAEIHDVSTFNDVIPEQAGFAFVSGTGEISATLQVNDQIADGTLDLDADDIELRTKEVPFRGDFELHANLTKGDLPAKHFDFSGTTLRLDNIVNEQLSEKKQGKLDAWFCEVEIGNGDLTVGKPLAADGDLRLKMHGSRPVMALLKGFGVGPGWLSMAPNIRDIDGTLKLRIGDGLLAFKDLDMTGDGFEALGWMHVKNKKAEGRLFARIKAVMAGVSMDGGKPKIHLSKPRKWFEEQPKGPSDGPVSTDKPVPAASETP
jgi:hypothetical protein